MMLLGHGADPNVALADGGSPMLRTAVFANDAGMVTELLHRSADLT